ncbi:ras GEF [Exidia glandulosa HHB12029]|uniref:Ras GEF n=1 Tax=Exidia glandulosa HHB12029 TaxID=1314781 RepID=A0A165JLL9_EXIGL|nr:ras GEF [Exidia glandulosa HHB12029]
MPGGCGGDAEQAGGGCVVECVPIETPADYMLTILRVSDDVDLTTTARQALKSLTAFSEFVANINVTKMDVDGHQDGHRLSKADAEAYANSVAQGRVLVRNLEAALQMVMDDSSALLGVCQNARDLQTALPKTLSSLTLGIDLACQTLRGMIQVVSTQKSISTPRRFSAASLRLPHARKSSAPRIEPIPPTHAGIQEHNPRLPLPPPINIEPVQPQASGSRHHAASNANGGDDQDDDMVDMELAFSRGPARPRAPSDFDATALFYGAPPKDDSRESDSPEPGDRASEEFSQHSRTTSQPTTLGSMGPPSSSVPENESNSALPLKDMSKLDIDDDDEDLTSTKSSRKRAPKIKQFFGDDAPQYMLNQLKESPAYLRPDYAPSDIIIHPDGSVRAGTLPALIEHLTMHDFRDALFFNSFLTTFKTFATADDVVDQLIKRFHLRPPEGLDDDQMRDWKEQKQTVVRIRVINTFKSMLGDEDVMSKDDVDALETIEDFAADAQRVSPPAKQLLSLVERVRRGGNQSVIKMTANMTLNPPPAIYPKNSKKMKLLDIDPLELARQMTIMESKLFCTIRASECLQRSQASTGDRSDNIRNIIVTSNKIADWVADSILANEDHRKRGALIKLFITAAERCRSLQNFSTMAAFIAGLNSPPIRRLKRSWESVGKSLVATFDSVEKTLDSGRSFQNYKATLSKVDPPCVPFLGVYLTTLTFIQDGSPDTLKEGNLINFNKRHKIAEVIREMKTFQAKPYNLTPIPYVLSFIEDSISSLKMSADDFWNLSLVREPREKDDEKMQRLLTESGFL